MNVATSKRPKRTSINGVRNVLSVQGKEPGFVYRVVNDVGDRVAQFEELGYEIVRDKEIKVGDKRVTKPTADGSPVQVSVGGGTQAFIMRIKQDWYDEDQKAKMEHVDKLESSMKSEAQTQGMYGKIAIS